MSLVVSEGERGPENLVCHATCNSPIRDSSNFFFFFKRAFPFQSSILKGKTLIYLLQLRVFTFSPLRRNVVSKIQDYSIPINRDAPSLKILSKHLNTNCPLCQSSHLILQNILGITQSQIPIPISTWKSQPTQSSSNPQLPLTLHYKCKPFYYISYDQRSIMTCLSNPAQYRGNPSGYHTSPYTKSYSSSCGNCHHKETSPTTGDQTQLPPQTKESHRPSMSIRI